MALILASTSPRRRELLALLSISFDVKNPSFEERLVADRPAIDQVQSFAQGKARSVAIQEPEAIVLGSDTVIELDHGVLGKPADPAEARAMLRRLAGRDHYVCTAVALVCSAIGIDVVALSSSVVRMKPFDERAHERYLATGESLGKAGAYSIQGEGGDLVDSIDGDFPTVVGLPLRLVAQLLTQAGVSVPVDLDELYAVKPYANWARFSG
ncbi:MAG: septum formation protein Maf [Nitrospira sp. CG24C]|nr:MAG: septum formation protein Maf [Nitrospira sp. CG24C]TKB55640.1 MAG: septum formation protein Maf [Nitrospira sp.]